MPAKRRDVLGICHYGYGARISSSAFDAEGRTLGIRGSIDVKYRISVAPGRIRAVTRRMKIEPEAYGRYSYSAAHIEQLQTATGSKYKDGLPRAGDTFNFNGPIRRLGQALAYYTSPQGDYREPDWILGNNPLVISEARAAGRSYRASGFYIQMHATDGRVDAHTMGVIAYAAAATGAPVYVSELYIQNGNWATRLPTGVALLECIHRAAQILIDAAALSGGGVAALFSYTTGFHDVVSVKRAYRRRRLCS